MEEITDLQPSSIVDSIGSSWIIQSNHLPCYVKLILLDLKIGSSSYRVMQLVSELRLAS